MADMHLFDVVIAKKYGLNCAIVLQCLSDSVSKNRADGKNYRDGRYWTHNSVKELAELLPYFTRRQIETVLQKLRDEGLVITGNYNAMKYDRSLWYAIAQTESERRLQQHKSKEGKHGNQTSS